MDPSFQSKIDVQDFWDVFKVTQSIDDKPELSEEDAKLLNQAYLMTKSVPRRSNRSKWKDEANYSPNLMCGQAENDGKLLSGDIIFSKVLNKVLALKVIADTPLLDMDGLVEVEVLDGTCTLESIKIHDLVTERGLIFVVPSLLYHIEDGLVIFKDTVSLSVEDVINSIQTASLYTDEELADLPSSKKSADKGKKKKKREWIYDEPHFEIEQNNSAKNPYLFSSLELEEIPGKDQRLLQWVKVVYDGNIFLGKIQNIHEKQCLVRCLDRPFGVDEGKCQDMEPENDAVWHDNVYITDVEPVMIQETGKRGRWRYLYGKEI